MEDNNDNTIEEKVKAVVGPITADGERPQKKFYRQRAHCNPLAHNDNFEYPTCPNNMNWTIDHYPSFAATQTIDENHKQQLQHVESNVAISSGKSVGVVTPTVLDIGCGFGGLTMALASILPNELVLGMEIRAKVTEYVRLRIANARREHILKQSDSNQNKQTEDVPDATKDPDITTEDNTNNNKEDDVEATTKLTIRQLRKRQKRTHNGEGKPINSREPNEKIEHRITTHHYNNCSVIRTNSMKFLQNYFYKHSIAKLFICFPDPHFKRKNHPRRIITVRLLTEYAYILQQGIGKLYCITDVQELHVWHIAALNEHPLFEPVFISSSTSVDNVNDTTILDNTIHNDDDDDSRIDQKLINAMKNETEEGQKVTRNKGQKFFAIYRRINDNEISSSSNNNNSDKQINSTNFFSN